MYLYELRRGQRCTVPEHPDLGVLVFLGMDGMYGQVRAEDSAVQAAAVARFDAEAPFFCLAAATEVVPEGSCATSIP